jgi:hypothetical protein
VKIIPLLILLVGPTPIPVPGGEGGIGFDDLVFSASLGRFVVPGGRTGSVFLLDPATRKLQALGQLSKLESWQGGHGQSATSADAREDTLFVADRTTRRLVAIPVHGGAPVETALESGPDYVRWVEPTSEVWVTEPEASAIEVFRFERGAKPALVRVGKIAVTDGPESLVIDPAHGRAFTNTWHDRTLAIGLKDRRIGAQWSNGCKGARGLAADLEQGLLFVGCAEGAATVIDTSGKGRVAGRAATGAGVDIVAYAVSTRRLYVPSGKTGTLEVLAVEKDGSLRSLNRVPAEKDSHCVAVDEQSHVLVCDPRGGRLLFYEDEPPGSAR